MMKILHGEFISIFFLSQLDSTIFWSEEELAELKGTRLLSTTLGVEEYVENEFSKLEQDILLPNKDMFPICQNLFLIPLADLINSRPELKKIWCLAYPAEQNSRPELKKILLVWSQTA